MLGGVRAQPCPGSGDAPRDAGGPSLNLDLRGLAASAGTAGLAGVAGNAVEATSAASLPPSGAGSSHLDLRLRLAGAG